jgi:hypothetical protein
MEPEPAPQVEIKDENLPSQLAAQLSPPTRDALGHPVRRQILRALNDSDEPRGPAEIAAATLPHTSISVISYHAQVLASRDCVALAGTRQEDGTLACLYTAKVADNEQVSAVLRATRELDRWAVEPRR